MAGVTVRFVPAADAQTPEGPQFRFVGLPAQRTMMNRTYNMAQAKQRANRCRAFVITVFVTYTQGERRKHRPRFDALQAFDPDIAHLERLQGPGRLGRENQSRHGRNGPHAKAR